ncbi:MAG: M13 family metallopeptidase [Firmicutes bacterium]|nr:M13 family metallopeptidase [Bacillota bacterium]
MMILASTGIVALASTPGLDTSAMDRSVKPGDDFYAYANGGWMKATAIPADRGSYGVFAEVAERTNARIADLIDRVAKGRTTPSRDQALVRDFHASVMDVAGIEAKGLRPLKPVFKRIAAIHDRTQLARYLGDGLRADVDAFNATNLTTRNVLGLWVAQDLKDPSRYQPFLLQGGLSLPDKDYYLSEAPRMVALRKAYRSHIAGLLKLAQIPEPEAKADRILELETRIAQSHRNREDSGDVEKGYNPWTRADFDTKAPGLDWSAYFTAAGLGTRQDFVVWQPEAVVGLSALVASVPLDIWKEYLVFQALDRAAFMLPKRFADASFAFYGQTLGGVPQQRARGKRAVDLTSEALGQLVGKLYVHEYFSAEDKARVQAMVGHLLKAFERRIDGLEWMKPETKAKAKAKLAVMKVGVGYPDTWIDYAPLKINRKDVLGNLERIDRFELARQLAKLQGPVDRSEWVMTPHVVNAVNLPAMNAMNFPAGMLQPPYFDAHQPDVLNYGAIGAIIGHEISHSFDDQGALFDATGRLSNWWTPEDLAHFQASAAKLVAQYNSYRPFPDVAVNGKLTLGENIADVAGLAVAFDAFRLAQKDQPTPAGAFSAEQQFFLAYAQSWRDKAREPVLRRRILTDGHAPAQYRTYTVRNLDAWYAAFGVEPGQKLYLKPEDRVRIW